MTASGVPQYEPQAIEAKWQRIWQQRRQHETDESSGKPKFYLLEMLPYPSGDLHVGHARNYTLGDVVGRFARMRGFNVLHPMGWDAFGLPAENAAIERGIDPREWTSSNISNMRRQIQRLGVAYDWSREIDTSSPEYYRWTQWLFLLMYRKGLAYKDAAPVNWCPSCRTVLANEQAEGGVCWRCESKVERRFLNQWFLRITAYADRLLQDLDRLNGWPERVKTMQRNWIGRSQGVSLSFDVEGRDDRITVFTTRLDTVFGATFLAIAAEHELLEKLVAGNSQADKVRAFAAALKDKSDLERTQLMDKQGVFTGAHAIHPMTGERVPIWVTNYVLAAYGTAAVMGVPAHDDRDLAFAREHGLSVTTVVGPGAQAARQTAGRAYLDEGILVNSDEYDGLTSEQARKVIAEDLIERGIAHEAVNYKLRDWLLSRQRYWGAPIPFVSCETDGLVPVPEDQLPVLLPVAADISGTSGSPLEHVPEFLRATCPRCGGPALRETETMDTFIDSSWYYLRYLSPHDAKAPWDSKAVLYWAPVDQYIGGIEHAVLHLIYARFVYKVLADERLVPGEEPFLRLFNQGMVLGENHEKMSKSRGNVVGINEAADAYGVDALRIFEMFAAPPEADFPWSTTGISGATRTLSRIWRLVLANTAHLQSKSPAEPTSIGDHVLSLPERELRYGVHSKLKQVTEELTRRMHLNTCVAAIMILLNDLEAFAASSPEAVRSAAWQEGVRVLLLLLAPFAPHVAEELWSRVGMRGSIHQATWPQHDELALRRDEVTIVVQVDGKRRGSLQVPAGADEEAVLAQALELPTVKAQIDGKSVRRKVYVRDRLLNIVAG